ncbi:MAG: glutamate-1-semialdehyde 2,1-aminomutase [Candidatus Omnitrophica bacterium]|nr:glutamate-1-semialdehyde 2,1-aminomutase [Candidatus Omnitrophota bacterium]
MITEKNRALLQKAQGVFVGGVNSPIRAFKQVGGYPVPIRKGRGSKMYDYDGKEYIDYVLSYGVHILGHANPEIINGIKKIVDFGLSFGATHDLEIKLAERLRKAIPALEKIRFVSSGTEAVMGAVRLARGITGRDKIIKFEGSYHGHADYLLVKSGGVPKNFIQHTLIAPNADNGYLDKIFERNKSGIAAVLVEPVGGNNGVVLPNEPFLKHLRYITKRYGALLIFDEVITGFRFHFGSAADYFDVKPDILCLGKIIGGGLPIGAYGGGEKIMNHLAPLGNVYQASTFSGNPIVMHTGITTLKRLDLLKGSYRHLNNLVIYLSQALSQEAKRHNIDVSIRHFGTMFSIYFKKSGYFSLFHKTLLKEGIYLAPSEQESNFISFSHDKKDIEKTINAARKVFGILAERGRA